MKVEDFKNSVIENNISKWGLHDCSICGYTCAYVFVDGEVYYDSGCYCTNRENLSRSSYEDLLELYNIQSEKGRERMERDFNLKKFKVPNLNTFECKVCGMSFNVLEDLYFHYDNCHNRNYE